MVGGGNDVGGFVGTVGVGFGGVNIPLKAVLNRSTLRCCSSFLACSISLGMAGMEGAV